MSTPAADCGVVGGCGACPLGRAGVCGDPVPGGVQLALFAPPVRYGYVQPDTWVADAPDVDPAEPRPAGGCCGGGCGG